jgi:ABC-type transporter Mla subunit MlaD
VLIFVLALVQAGRLREWFDPGATIKVILPAEGLFGLTQGAQVDLLGTRAGEVRRIVLAPDRPLHAEIYVRKAMLAFVRRDSQAIIRKQCGVAGASYLELTRGSGEPLDWEYAVLTATAERAPTDVLHKSSESLPQLIPRLQATLASLQEVLTDLHRTTPELPRITKGLAHTTESLPLLMVQTEQTLDNLDKLLRQLRGLWLLGGRRSEAQQESSRRLPALEITP